MSTTRQRRTPKKSPKSPIHGAKRASKSPTRATPKSSKKSNRTSLSSSPNKNKNKKSSKTDMTEENSDCGFEIIEDKRRSKRLQKKKEEEEEENSSSDSDSDSSPKSTFKTTKKRKRSQSTDDDAKSPPKKKPRKALSKKKNTSNFISDPSFTNDRKLLLRIGIGYTKQKTSPKRVTKRSQNKRIAKLYYKSQKKYNNAMYKWHNNGIYKLLKINEHKLETDINIVLADNEEGRMWLNSINYKPIRMMVENEAGNGDGDGDDEEVEDNNSNNNNEIVIPFNGNTERKHDDSDGGIGNESDSSDAETPQVYFGKLLFKCEWEDWGKQSWETWDKISETDLFKNYCKDKEWRYDDELQATVMEHDDDHFKTIIENIRLYGNPTTRKALKMIINKELNVW